MLSKCAIIIHLIKRIVSIATVCLKSFNWQFFPYWRKLSTISNMYRLLLISLVTLFMSSVAVDHSNFKTCQQSGFCRRHRQVKGQKCPWSVVPDTVHYTSDKQSVEAQIKHAEYGLMIRLELMAPLLDGSVLRMRMNEPHTARERFQAHDALLDNIPYNKVELVSKDEKEFIVKFGDPSRKQKAVITNSPFRIDVYADDKLIVSGNARGFLNFEHYRRKEEFPPELIKEEDGLFEETFKSFTDPKPFGPMSVGMDFSFVDFDHVYGIPEHADSFALRDTREEGVDPYRLYNVDVFEYELNSPMALYGAIPMMVAHSAQRTVGLLWLNPSETWIDVESHAKGVADLFANLVGSESKARLTHWFSETGVIDAYIMLGPKPEDVMKQNALLTGTTPLPPYYSIGFHQCRWNYFSQDEVAEVDRRFDEIDIPLDAIWLDIEYTEDRSKKYFTWDPVKFSDPRGLTTNLTSKGRRLITIIDPHIKRDSNYPVFNEGVQNNYFIKTKDDVDYDGWCWPGSSMWPDYLNPAVSEWWASKFNPEFFPGFPGGIVDIWNDMNEPSVFNGPEISCPRDLKHYNGVENRELHNMYGFYMTRATFNGMSSYRQGLRPFILTRSFFVGSQRFCAAWTGDNMAKWDHLKASIPMMLSLSVVGMSFVGADVGGFFGNPDNDLLIRWYQLGAFQPFYRAHAHLESRHREAYLLDEKTQHLIRSSIRLRYSYLPYMYTLFHENSLNGSPPFRPLWFHFPKDTNTFKIEHEFMLGDSLLLAPVLEKDVNSIDVYLPGEGESWLDLETFTIYKGATTVTLPVTISNSPRFQRSGTIIVRRERSRRSAALTHSDPVTLDIFLDSEESKASGKVYLDDGTTFAYKTGAYVLANIQYDQKEISYTIEHGGFPEQSWVERINIYRISNKPTKIEATSGASLSFKYDSEKKLLVIRKPALPLIDNWRIRLTSKNPHSQSHH